MLCMEEYIHASLRPIAQLRPTRKQLGQREFALRAGIIVEGVKGIQNVLREMYTLHASELREQHRGQRIWIIVHC